ncbi:MAG: hypothetical protein Q9162_002027 [Coniocarpon cinnabarinum]
MHSGRPGELSRSQSPTEDISEFTSPESRRVTGNNDDIEDDSSAWQAARQDLVANVAADELSEMSSGMAGGGAAPLAGHGNVSGVEVEATPEFPSQSHFIPQPPQGDAMEVDVESARDPSQRAASTSHASSGSAMEVDVEPAAKSSQRAESSSGTPMEVDVEAVRRSPRRICPTFSDPQPHERESEDCELARSVSSSPPSESSVLVRDADDPFGSDSIPREERKAAQYAYASQLASGAPAEQQITRVEPHRPKVQEMLQAWRPFPDHHPEIGDYPQLAECIKDVDRNMSPSDKSFLQSQWDLSQAIGILGQIHPSVMDALITGTLPRKCVEDASTTSRIFRWQPESNNSAEIANSELPCVYVNVVANLTTGEGLTRDHVEMLCDDFDLLAEQDLSDRGKSLLKKINEYLESQKTHFRGLDVFTLSRSSKKKQQDPERIRRDHAHHLHNFAVNNSLSVKDVQGQHGVLTFSETGLTIPGATDRMSAHKTFSQSPLLLTLVRAICNVHWPGVYSLWYFVPYLADSWYNLRFAEALLTNLTSSYVFAGGCNYHPAGLNSIDCTQESFWLGIRELLWSRGVVHKVFDNLENYKASIDAAVKSHDERLRSK